MTASPRIGYAAMTHLGLNSAVAAAAKGFETVCFDADRALIDRLANGDLPVAEPDLPELLAANRARIAFTAEVADLARCDVVYVALDVPTDDAGGSDLAGLDRLLELIVPALGPGATLVVLSQVPPGFTRARLRPGLSLYYQVETLIFGRAMERALRPERFIVGCADPTQPLPPALQAYLGAFGCPILPMRFESAELSKIAINCCLVSSISVANTLAELCEGIGAEWGEIAPALKLDRRIGPHAYLEPRPRHRRRQPRARPRDRHPPRAGDRQRRRRGSRLARQQPASARLGGAHHQARAAGQDPGGDGGGVGPRLQGEHQLGEELPVAGHAPPAARTRAWCCTTPSSRQARQGTPPRPAPPSRCKPSPAPMR